MQYTTKTFLKKMKYRRKHWDSLINTIIKKRLDKEKISEKWYFKDVICHITWYDIEVLKALETKSIVESKFWNASISERNEMIFNDTQEITLDKILKESKRVFKDLINKIEDLSDEDLNSDEYIKRKSDKRITWDFVGANDFWHFEDHEDVLIERFDLDYGM
ncbi:MAG: hypothetical protein HeimAB125_03460 [Candidatus Heimdallarchaeota archaeon AB_125]|nr:MAG: hypothetical protein HeimAB125_03460 [Candidatus Heimdallarchaeota archaeon AB_125]